MPISPPPEAFGGRRIVIARHRETLDRLRLTTLDEVRRFQGERLKDHRGRRDILRIATTDTEGLPLVLYLKRTWRPYRKDGLRQLLRGRRVRSISRIEWDNARRLEDAGLHYAARVAFGEDCSWCWERFSFLITEAAPGDCTLDAFLRDEKDRRCRRTVLHALGREVRRLHDAGLASPDLFTRHIFLRWEGREPAFCLIDMARLDQGRGIASRLRTRDLTALHLSAPQRWVTPSERLQFLGAYEPDRRERRQLVVSVIRRSQSLLRRRRKFRDFSAPGSPPNPPASAAAGTSGS